MFALLEKGKLNQDEVQKPDSNLECLLNDIFFGHFHNSDIVSKCENLDILEIFNVCDAIDEEYLNIRLENSVLENFLQQNDPKMLIGLTEEGLRSELKKAPLAPEADAKIKFGGPVTEKSFKNIRGVDAESVASSQLTLTGKRSIAPSFTAQALENKTREYRLNYKTKVELTDKSCKFMKDQIRSLERAAYNEFKLVGALVEEINYQLTETNETLESFDRNVVELGCDKITGVLSSEKFVKFAQSFLRTGMATCAKMRITSNNLEQEITFLRNMLVHKQEKSVFLTDADFEALKIQKDVDRRAANIQINGVDFLKDFKGRVSYGLNYIKKELVGTEIELKKYDQKIENVRNHILKIRSDTKLVKVELDIAKKNLERLKELNENISAPRTDEYIILKGKLEKLEKERKKLKQQIYLLHIRLRNAVQKRKISK